MTGDSNTHFDDDLDFGGEPARAVLSPEGERRKVEMLRDLEGAVTARRRRRTVLRAGTAAVAAVLAVLAAVELFRLATHRPAAPDRAPDVAQAERVEPRVEHVHVETVATDSGILALASVPTDPAIADRARIDDDSLLDVLAAAGKPAGLVRFDGRAMLTGLVTDDTKERSPIDPGAGSDGSGT